MALSGASGFSEWGGLGRLQGIMGGEVNCSLLVNGFVPQSETCYEAPFLQ